MTGTLMMSPPPLIKQDFLLLIFNCKKYKYKAEHQRKTWLRKLPNTMIFFHVIGDMNLSKPYIIDHNSNILYIKTPDDYNSLPQKVVSAYSIIYSLYDFKYIFKTDDDQQLYTPLFFERTMEHLINNNELHLSKKIHYGGDIVDVKKEHYSTYYHIHPELPRDCWIRKTQYCSGRFYLLSREAVGNIIVHKNRFSKEYFEDYFVGLILDPQLKTNMWMIPTKKHFIDQQWNY